MFQVDDEDALIKDEFGRTVLLRGVNLSGNSKIPFFKTHQEFLDEYKMAIRMEPHKISFVGRPFPLDECEEHFKRLKHWGFTFNRLLVTWEALEHAGPGQYDEEYIDYLDQLVTIGEKYGLNFYIDPHQDVWSRLTNGDGAPGWTYDKVGFVPQNFNVTGAAHVNIDLPLQHHDWPDEYGKLAPCTMFSLFFGGNDFAPVTKIDGESAQDYLQSHYANAFKQLMKKLVNHKNVIAHGTMNEPSHGYINWEDLNSSAFRWQFRLPKSRKPNLIEKDATEMKSLFNRLLHKKSSGSPVNLRMKITPTPFQSMLLGEGIPQRVDNWGILFGPMVFGKKWVNKERKRVWKEGFECVWKQNGVWGFDKEKKPFIKSDYFTRVNGKEILFERDYLRPFANFFAKEIRTVSPTTMIFVQSTPMFPLTPWHSGKGDAGNVVNSSHWYDYFSIFTGIFLPFMTMNFYENGKFVFGAKNRQRMFEQQLQSILDSSIDNDGDMPDIIGEFGIAYKMPFNLNFLFNWFGMDTAAMDASFRALEALLLNGTIYNYTPANTNKYGDGWNKEDLSIFSRSQQKNPADINSGARALKGFLRPYPMRISGRGQKLSYDMKSGKFFFRFRHFENINAFSEIFIPLSIYNKGFNVQVSDGTYTFDTENQLLTYRHTPEISDHEITITPK